MYIRNADSGLFDKAMKYINDSEEYTIESYVKHYKLDEGAKYNGNYIWISCPHHEDKSPSMSINTLYNIYRCFGCGRGGGFVKFVTEHQNTLGNKCTVYNVVDNILQDNKIMQNVIGCNTIFKRKTVNINDLKITFNRPTKFNRLNETNFTILGNVFKNKNIDDKIYAVALMQGGMSPEEITNIFSKPKEVSEEINDFNVLLKGED